MAKSRKRTFWLKKKKKAKEILMLFLKQNQIKLNLKKKAQERILTFFYDQFLTSGVKGYTFIFIT